MPLLAPSLAEVLSVSRISTELVNAKQEMNGLHQHILSSSKAQMRRGLVRRSTSIAINLWYRTRRVGEQRGARQHAMDLISWPPDVCAAVSICS